MQLLFYMFSTLRSQIELKLKMKISLCMAIMLDHPWQSLYTQVVLCGSISSTRGVKEYWDCKRDKIGLTRHVMSQFGSQGDMSCDPNLIISSAFYSILMKLLPVGLSIGVHQVHSVQPHFVCLGLPDVGERQPLNEASQQIQAVE